MIGFMVFVVLGALFLSVVPSLVPPPYRSRIVAGAVRGGGVVCILFAFASASYVFAPDLGSERECSYELGWEADDVQRALAAAFSQSGVSAVEQINTKAVSI